MTLSPIPKLTILQPLVSLADPHIASDNKNRLSILAALCEALVCRDERGCYQPALAQSWQVTEDARTWTFRLRPEVRCHNGDLLTAADAIASLERAFSPALGGDLGTEGLYQSYFQGAALQATADQTFHLQLARPMADALDLLVDIPILPQRALADLPNQLVGTGPYRLVEVQPDAVASWRLSPALSHEPPPFSTTGKSNRTASGGSNGCYWSGRLEDPWHYPVSPCKIPPELRWYSTGQRMHRLLYEQSPLWYRH
ncbi:MAG: ABC transporter substrate-binding protein [Anaerolineae bacterium]